MSDPGELPPARAGEQDTRVKMAIFSGAKAFRASVESLARKRSLRAIANNMVAMTMARVLVLVMSVFIARRMGPEGFGTFSFATGTAILIAQLASFGWPTLLNKLIPAYIHEEDWSRLRGLNFAADIVVFVGMAFMAAVLTGIAFAFLDRSNPLFTGLLVAAVLVIPSGGRLLNRQRMAAIGRAATGIFLDLSMVPLVVLGALLIFPMSSSLEVYGVYAGCTYISATVARLLYRRWTNPAELSALRTTELRSWSLIAFPMITAVASRVVLNRIDVVMLAPLSSVYEVGLFNTAFRIALLATFLPGMTSPVVRPMLAGRYAARDYGQVAKIMRHYYVFTGCVALTIALIMFFFARPILVGFFGAQFEPAVPVLRILAVGSFFGSVAEASSSYLLMCNREKIYGIMSMVGLAVAVALNLWLIPIWGAKGAAITSVLVDSAFFVGAVALVSRGITAHRRLGKAEA